MTFQNIEADKQRIEVENMFLRTALRNTIGLCQTLLMIDSWSTFCQMRDQIESKLRRVAGKLEEFERARGD